MPIEPYLFFNGHCEEAIEYYKKTLGAEVDMMMRFREAPQQPPEDSMPKDFGDKIMHSQLRVGDAIFLASDGMTKDEPSFKGISLTLTAHDENECRKWFDALAKDGTVQMPLNKTFFAKSFGSVADRFGVSWMVIVPEQMPG